MFGSSGAVFGSYICGDLDKVYNKNIIGSGKTVAIRIEDLSTNPTFTLDTMLLEFRQNDSSNMAGYTRQDTANNIANGNVIDADDFDAVQRCRICIQCIHRSQT